MANCLENIVGRRRWIERAERSDDKGGGSRNIQSFKDD